MVIKKNYCLFIVFSLLEIGTLYSQTNSDTVTLGPEKGSLLIVGGGRLGQEIWDKFIELAGGKTASFVVIPTAIGDNAKQAGEAPVSQIKNMGIINVQLLHSIDPAEANKEEFVTPLLKASGVWFSGGRQWRLADSYLDTRTQKELEKLLDRGGVIGGTSAGATIMGSYMVRGDTKNNAIMMGDHTIGMNFLKNATIDQHVMRRNRQFDLIPVIEKFPKLLGIGIDEGTAIIVKQDRFEVIGPSYVGIYDAKQWKVQKDKDGNITQPFYYLSSGQQFDLKNRKLITTSTLNSTNK
jgi:cyanophycinase